MASASSKKVIYAALAGNFLIAVTKFIAFVVTGSSAMMSEGVHSVVDTGNQILLLYVCAEPGCRQMSGFHLAMARRYISGVLWWPL